MIHLGSNFYFMNRENGIDFSNTNIKRVLALTNDLLITEELRQAQVDFNSLNEIIEAYGGLEMMITALSSAEDLDTILYLEGEDYVKLTMQNFKSVFPSAKEGAVRAYLRDVLIHKGITRRDDSLVEIDPYTVSIPDSVPFSDEVLSKVGFEFLLSHCIATNFEDDIYRKSLFSKINQYLKRQFCRDYAKAKVVYLGSSPLHGQYDLLGKGVISKDEMLHFSKNYKNPEAIFENLDHCKLIVSFVMGKLRYKDDLTSFICKEITKEGFTDEQILKAIEMDMALDYSKLFTQPSLNDKVVSTFIQRLYRNPSIALRLGV